MERFIELLKYQSQGNKIESVQNELEELYAQPQFINIIIQTLLQQTGSTRESLYILQAASISLYFMIRNHWNKEIAQSEFGNRIKEQMFKILIHVQYPLAINNIVMAVNPILLNSPDSWPEILPFIHQINPNSYVRAMLLIGIFQLIENKSVSISIDYDSLIPLAFDTLQTLSLSDSTSIFLFSLLVTYIPFEDRQKYFRTFFESFAEQCLKTNPNIQELCKISRYFSKSIKKEYPIDDPIVILNQLAGLIMHLLSLVSPENSSQLIIPLLFLPLEKLVKIFGSSFSQDDQIYDLIKLTFNCAVATLTDSCITSELDSSTVLSILPKFSHITQKENLIRIFLEIQPSNPPELIIKALSLHQLFDEIGSEAILQLIKPISDFLLQCFTIQHHSVLESALVCLCDLSEEVETYLDPTPFLVHIMNCFMAPDSTLVDRAIRTMTRLILSSPPHDETLIQLIPKLIEYYQTLEEKPNFRQYLITSISYGVASIKQDSEDLFKLAIQFLSSASHPSDDISLMYYIIDGMSTLISYSPQLSESYGLLANFIVLINQLFQSEKSDGWNIAFGALANIIKMKPSFCDLFNELFASAIKLAVVTLFPKVTNGNVDSDDIDATENALCLFDEMVRINPMLLGKENIPVIMIFTIEFLKMHNVFLSKHSGSIATRISIFLSIRKMVGQELLQCLSDNKPEIAAIGFEEFKLFVKKNYGQNQTELNDITSCLTQAIKFALDSFKRTLPCSSNITNNFDFEIEEPAIAFLEKIGHYIPETFPFGELITLFNEIFEIISPSEQSHLFKVFVSYVSYCDISAITNLVQLITRYDYNPSSFAYHIILIRAICVAHIDLLNDEKFLNFVQTCLDVTMEKSVESPFVQANNIVCCSLALLIASSIGGKTSEMIIDKYGQKVFEIFNFLDHPEVKDDFQYLLSSILKLANVNPPLFGSMGDSLQNAFFNLLSISPKIFNELKLNKDLASEIALLWALMVRKPGQFLQEIPFIQSKKNELIEQLKIVEDPSFQSNLSMIFS